MRFYPIGGGGGADLDVVTAGAEHVLAPKVIVDKDGNPITGVMINRTGTALTVATNGKTLIPQGYHDGTQYATNSQATLAGGTLTPSTSQVTVSCSGKLMTSNYVIPAFSLPSASVIKKGTKVTIYGKSVTGTWEGYATSPLYLYNKGTWGGLSTTGATIVADDSRYIAQKSNKFIFGDTGSSTYRVRLDLFRLNQSFNLTNYNYIKVVECGTTWDEIMGTNNDNTLLKNGFICVGVSGSALSSVNTPSSSTGTPSGLTKYAHGHGTVVLDVSSLSGNYWIYFGGIRDQGRDFGANGLNQVFVSTS